MNWNEAQQAVQKKYGWSDQKTQYSADWYGSTQGDDSADMYWDDFVSGTDTSSWVQSFESALPQMISDAKHQAEQAYNTLTKGIGIPQIPGKQYVQNNWDGSFTTVWTTPSLKAAQDGYNAVDYGGSNGFVVGKRYVQANMDGTFTVVIRYPLDY